VVVISFFALFKIIRKAGYRSWWLVLPLVMLLLWVITWVVVIVDFNQLGISGAQIRHHIDLNQYPMLTKVDGLATIVVWILFVVFALSDWPVLDSGSAGTGYTRVTGRSKRQAAAAPQAVEATTFAPMGLAMPVPTTEARSPTVPPAPSGSGEVASALGGEEVLYCSWCGTKRDEEASTLHYCGSTSRPTAYCQHCGSAISAGEEQCRICGGGTIPTLRR
jgi:hypothetical protein